jgi:putative transposase
MARQVQPLTTYPEEQRAQALERFALIRPFLEEGIPLACIAREQHLPLRTARRWVAEYRAYGLVGLIRQPRMDQGKRRGLPADLQPLIEGLALQKPRRSIAAIHRQVVQIAEEQSWPHPSYDQVYAIIKALDPRLLTLAHEGSAAYRDEFDLVYRFEAAAPNVIWQADHSLLPIWLLDERGQPAQPWLTIILDDFSRGVPGYFLGFANPTALQTALTLHQAIWRKGDARWRLCGIPSVFYTDHGSDFTSWHMEQVAVDLKMELVFSQVGIPRGRGKIERFFRSVEQLFLSTQPGYAPEGRTGVVPSLSLPLFDTRFRDWLLESYHQRPQEDLPMPPQARWEASAFLPQMPDSLEQLDLLLLTVAKGRQIQRDGIRFQGYRYIDPTLAAYVGEAVTIRYDPRDLAVIRVFYQERFLCQAVCSELADQTVSLKEIVRARKERRIQVRQGLDERRAVVERYIGVHQSEPSASPPDPQPPSASPRLKRYFNE